MDHGGVQQQPLVNEEAEEAEEHAHAGADDAAAQAIDGVGQVVIAGSADAVDDEFQRDGRYEYRNRESHRPAVGGVHLLPGDIISQGNACQDDVFLRHDADFQFDR